MTGNKGFRLNAFLDSRLFRVYLLPGFVFQSVVIAGGYGTGRELVEFFLNYGPIGGLLGMFLVTATMWAIVLSASYEFARVFKQYDYRGFFKELLGPFWPVYEVLYILLLFLVLAVVGAASGSILRDTFGIPYLAGVVGMLVGVVFLAYYGSKAIETYMSWWSFALYAVYIVFLVAGLSKFGPSIAQAFGTGEVKPGWALAGFKYGLYNLGCIPAVLFTLGSIEKRSEAVVSGILSSLIAILPAFFFYVVVVGGYPEILKSEIPALFALTRLGSVLILAAYEITLFGTLIETGIGFIHGVNERVAATLREKGQTLTSPLRAVIALVMAVLSIGMSRFGLINLIAKGYGSISWGFFVAHVIPVLTIGLVKIGRSKTLEVK
ncbi:MAG: hypothetical protein HPY55_00780 [Firmicutes bacterium]|nr:hypothetical protein [Bacillota bacterium]